MQFSIAAGNTFQETAEGGKTFEKVELYNGKTMHCVLNGGAEENETGLETGSTESDSQRHLYYIIICESAVIILMFTIIVIRAVYKRKKCIKTTKMSETVADELLLSEDPHYCAVCGKKAGIGAAFCRYCGSQMR